MSSNTPIAKTAEQEKLREIVKSGDPLAWDNAWQASVTPWDAGESQPPLREVIETGEVNFPHQGLALVPGCGAVRTSPTISRMGYDVGYLASALQHRVLGMDISETAMQKARTNFESVNIPSPGKVSFASADFFNYHPEEKFDLIYDYTFFVAIPPKRRVEWGAQMASLMKPGGYLITLVWPIEEPVEVGPPFFVRVEHYEKVLDGYFEKVLDKAPQTSLPKHVGKERMVVWKRLQ
ncbi:hypothetical protein H0H93_009007 [Arthromyces matolae]|nr:hypothetical protein H0H93_009007 [Arthromyces matolae]